AATDLRAGLQALLIRISARAIGTPGSGRPKATADEERGRLDPGSGHPEVLRHSGSCSLAGTAQAKGTRRGGAATDRQMAFRGSDGGGRSDVPLDGLPPGRGDLSLTRQ